MPEYASHKFQMTNLMEFLYDGGLTEVSEALLN